MSFQLSFINPWLQTLEEVWWLNTIPVFHSLFLPPTSGMRVLRYPPLKPPPTLVQSSSFLTFQPLWSLLVMILRWHLVHEYPNIPSTWKPICKIFKLDIYKKSSSLYYSGHIQVKFTVFIYTSQHPRVFRMLEKLTAWGNRIVH